MDWLTQQIADNKIPIGTWIAGLFDFLTENFAWFFDGVSDGLTFLIEGLTGLMLFLPPLVLIGLFAALAFLLHRSLWLAVMVVASLALIINQGYWEQTIETLALVIFATLVCMAVGVSPIVSLASATSRMITRKRISRPAGCWIPRTIPGRRSSRAEGKRPNELLQDSCENPFSHEPSSLLWSFLSFVSLSVICVVSLEPKPFIDPPCPPLPTSS